MTEYEFVKAWKEKEKPPKEPCPSCAALKAEVERLKGDITSWHIAWRSADIHLTNVFRGQQEVARQRDRALDRLERARGLAREYRVATVGNPARNHSADALADAVLEGEGLDKG